MTEQELREMAKRHMDQVAADVAVQVAAKMADMMRSVANTIYHASEASGTLTDAQWRSVLRTLAGYLSCLAAGNPGDITAEDVARRLHEVTDRS